MKLGATVKPVYNGSKLLSLSLQYNLTPAKQIRMKGKASIAFPRQDVLFCSCSNIKKIVQLENDLTNRNLINV